MSEATATSPATTDHNVDIGDVTLAVTEVGTGNPLVLVCGTSQSRHLWVQLASALAADRRVIFYDHRGIGESTRGTAAISVETLADDLSRLLTALGLRSADVLGWSLGSAVALRLAVEHPEQISSLALLNTWARTDVYQTAVFTALGHPWRTGDREVALAALGQAFSPEFLNSEVFPTVMGQVEPVFPATPDAMQTVAEQWAADIGHDVADQLSDIAVPVLVVTGEQDLLTPASSGREVAAALAGSTLYEFTGPGSSHAVLLERPDEVADVVAAFLRDNESRSAS